MYCEETDLAFRLFKEGYLSEYVPLGETIHLAGGSSADRARFNPEFFNSKIKYYKKHYGKIGLRIFVVVKMLGFFLRNILLLLRLDFQTIQFNLKIIKYYAKRFF